VLDRGKTLAIKGDVVMMKTSKPLLGWAFNDVLNELHQHVFEGVPDESEPFELTLLEREYIAFVLACYYQCDHCLTFHERAVRVARRKEKSVDWSWQDDLVSATLFLHLDGRKLSAVEWRRWLETWENFAQGVDQHHPCLARYIAYAVGIARHDTSLMDHSFTAISASIEDNDRLKGVVRDIDGVVVFMKAATSKNRSDPTIIDNLRSRGIENI
jgi:AhpD family alkylhydroperoxidase